MDTSTPFLDSLLPLSCSWPLTLLLLTFKDNPGKRGLQPCLLPPSSLGSETQELGVWQNTVENRVENTVENRVENTVESSRIHVEGRIEKSAAKALAEKKGEFCISMMLSPRHSLG